MSVLTPEQELVVCVSGGKDSAALALWLRFESGLKNPMFLVFCDTGHEHPATILHVHALAARVGLPLYVVKPPLTFIELCEDKQRFPSVKARFCTEELKVLPLSNWLEEKEGDGTLNDPVLCQGIRREESRARSEMPEWDTNNRVGRRKNVYDCPIWRPLIAWSVEEVFAIHKRHGFEPNPLYKLGARRVGCFPCIFSSKGDLKAAFKIDEGLLDRLRGYEERVIANSRRRAGSFFPADKTPRRFHDKSMVTEAGIHHTYASIDGVHVWAMGDENQGSLFEVLDGCVSHYGLCE